MRQVCTWGHVALHQGVCRSHAKVGLCCLTSSDALRGHVTRGPCGFPEHLGGGRCTPLLQEGFIRISCRG